MAVVDDRLRRDVADALRRGRIDRRVVGSNPLARICSVDPLLVLGIDVEQRAVRRVGDGLLLVRQRPLGRRAAQLAAQARADGLVVIRRPGVVHRRQRDGQRARDDRRPRPMPIDFARRRLERDVQPLVRRRWLCMKLAAFASDGDKTNTNITTVTTGRSVFMCAGKVTLKGRGEARSRVDLRTRSSKIAL